eukprot:182361_1
MTQIQQHQKSIFTNHLNEYSHSESKYGFQPNQPSDLNLLYNTNQPQSLTSNLTPTLAQTIQRNQIKPETLKQIKQTAGPTLKLLINEHSRLETQKLSQQTQYHPASKYQIQPQNLSQQTQDHPTFTHQPPLINSQYVYQPKKSGIVNEIINTINMQNQTLLEAIKNSQKQMSNINLSLFRKYDYMDKFEDTLKRNYCQLEEELNKKLSLIDELKGKVYHIELYQKIIQNQQYRMIDLVKFIYKYLNGKKKKNYLKNAMFKILGENNCDLRKYKLEEPTQLKDLFMPSIDGIDTNPHELNSIKGKFNIESEELITNNSIINNTNKNDLDLEIKEKEINQNSFKSLA